MAAVGLAASTEDWVHNRDEVVPLRISSAALVLLAFAPAPRAAQPVAVEAGITGQVLAPDGFAIVGDGGSNEYSIDNLTEDLWRLGLGLGWRFNQNLVLKAEYTFNQGQTLSGEDRRHENVVAAEVAFRF